MDSWIRAIVEKFKHFRSVGKRESTFPASFDVVNEHNASLPTLTHRYIHTCIERVMENALEKQFVKMARGTYENASFFRRSCCANRPSREVVCAMAKWRGQTTRANCRGRVCIQLFPEFIRVLFTGGTDIKINVQSRWRRSGAKRDKKGRERERADSRANFDNQVPRNILKSQLPVDPQREIRCRKLRRSCSERPGPL